MNFCFIAPATLCDFVAPYSKTHLVLPQVEDPRYVEFYTRKRREKNFLILDNGAYEGVTDWSFLTKAIDVYRPQVVVLPDYYMQEAEKTYAAAAEFLHRYRSSYPKVQWLYIPQTTKGRLPEFRDTMRRAIRKLDVDWIGLPRALVTHITGNKYARVDLVEELVSEGVKIHAFGMANGDLEELHSLFWAGCTSCDSSAPVWRGYHHRSLDLPEDREWWDKNGRSVDFSAPEPTTRAKVQITVNIERIIGVTR